MLSRLGMGPIQRAVLQRRRRGQEKMPSLLSALSSPSNETAGSPKRGVRTCQSVSKSFSALTIEPLNETGGCPQKKLKKCVKMYQSVSKSPNSLYVEALIDPLIGTRESPGKTCQRNVKTVHRLTLEWIRDPLPLRSLLAVSGTPPKKPDKVCRNLPKSRPGGIRRPGSLPIIQHIPILIDKRPLSVYSLNP